MGFALARHTGLAVEEIGQELVVFDSERQVAHSLNHVAATVWRACNGTRTSEQIAAHCELGEDVVALALDELTNCRLLAQVAGAPDSDRPRLSRRHVLRRAAVTGVGIGIALPVIRSITAPSPAMASSTARHAMNGNDCGGGPSAQGTCSDGSICTSGCVRGYGEQCFAGVPRSACQGGNSCITGTCPPSTNP
jgi:hypothetical protein